MKIAIMGCGAMGSVYAGLLAAGGHDVLAIDHWAEHVEAMAARGLRVEGASGDRVARVRAYREAPAEPVDLIIIAVKAAQAGSAAAQARAMLGPDTSVLTIQNGLGSADSVAQAIGADRLAVGIAAAFGASLSGPGHVHHNGMSAVRMGAYAGMPAERLADIAAVWSDAGFNAQAVDNLPAMQWEKLICNVAYSAPCALTGMTVGAAMDDPDVGAVSQAAAAEAWAVARALGIPIQVDDPVAHVRAFGERIRDAKPSVLLDHEHGRVSEIDYINGAIPVQARKAGLSAPVNETLTRLVKQRESGFSSGRT
ncbi:2-dehydropantoate 2-reductase [Achromobacter veterisilvae]|uniref:2-dehydropantoate 2-reductase n=1 Tax=Achromobacter veterisilvae TaxID=2069367 RepID=A0A446C367_9BURK|nr:2-dehydropantoate 2-reductase [Achromobacter veterisilvae]SSW62337.1 2-dehydropantoate 2-reductase [Achromobacter veterisilvae]